MTTPVKPKSRLQILVDALRRFGQRDKTEERAEGAKEASEVVNEALPTDISGREAVLKKRKQYRDIDKMLKDAEK